MDLHTRRVWSNHYFFSVSSRIFWSLVREEKPNELGLYETSCRSMAFCSFDPFLLVFSSSGRALSMPRYMPAKIEKTKPAAANQTKCWGRFGRLWFMLHMLQGLRLCAVTKLFGCLVIKSDDHWRNKCASCVTPLWGNLIHGVGFLPQGTIESTWSWFFILHTYTSAPGLQMCMRQQPVIPHVTMEFW